MLSETAMNDANDAAVSSSSILPSSPNVVDNYALRKPAVKRIGQPIHLIAPDRAKPKPTATHKCDDAVARLTKQ